MSKHFEGEGWGRGETYIVSLEEALLGTMFICGQRQYLSVVAKDVRGGGIKYLSSRVRVNYTKHKA